MNIFDPYTRVQTTPAYPLFHHNAKDRSQSPKSSQFWRTERIERGWESPADVSPLSTQLQLVAAIQAILFQ